MLLLTIDRQERQLAWADAAILKAQRAGVLFGNVPYGMQAIAEQVEKEAEVNADLESWESFRWAPNVSLYRPRSMFELTLSSLQDSSEITAKAVGLEVNGTYWSTPMADL